MLFTSSKWFNKCLHDSQVKWQQEMKNDVKEVFQQMKWSRKENKSIDLTVFLMFFDCLFLCLFLVSWEWFGRCGSVLWLYQWYNETNIWISDYHLIISFHSSSGRFEWDGLKLWYLSNLLLLFNNTFRIEIISLIYEIENENHKR